MFTIILCCEIIWGSVAECFTCILAFLAFTLSCREYCNHKKRERVNILTQLNVRYTTDKDICSVVKYLESIEDKKENIEIPEIHQIEMYMRFFEEINCLINAEALKVNIVYYMFGHYVLLFADNIDKLPEELEYSKAFWLYFREFVEKMKKAKEELYCYKTNNNEIDEYKINTKKIKL